MTPLPDQYPQDAYSADLKEEFKDLPNETDSGKQVALAGRMMSKRVMGKASFAHLRNQLRCHCATPAYFIVFPKGGLPIDNAFRL